MVAKYMNFEICHTSLVEKSDWHIKINGGLVPVLEMPDGSVMHESKVLAEHAIAV
jgi:glutathione S-transferase